MCETSSCMSHPVHPCPLSLCPSYCLSMGLPLCRCCCDGQCMSVIFEFLLWDQFVFSFVCLCYHVIRHCFGKKKNRDCCPPLLLLPETSNDTSVIHTFHSTHLHPTNTTNASQVLQTQQQKKKNKSTAGFPHKVVKAATFYLDDTLKGAILTRLQRCLKWLVEIQTKKSKQAQGWAASKTPQNHIKHAHTRCP